MSHRRQFGLQRIDEGDGRISMGLSLSSLSCKKGGMNALSSLRPLQLTLQAIWARYIRHLILVLKSRLFDLKRSIEMKIALQPLRMTARRDRDDVLHRG